MHIRVICLGTGIPIIMIKMVMKLSSVKGNPYTGKRVPLLWDSCGKWHLVKRIAKRYALRKSCSSPCQSDHEHLNMVVSKSIQVTSRQHKQVVIALLSLSMVAFHQPGNIPNLHTLQVIRTGMNKITCYFGSIVSSLKVGNTTKVRFVTLWTLGDVSVISIV